MVKKTGQVKNRSKSTGLVKGYAQTLATIKKKIQDAQIKAALAANKELMFLYWSIGKMIAEKQEVDGWGSNVIEQLAYDVQNAFSGVSGFSRRNLFRMKSFYLAYEKVPQAVAQLEKVPQPVGQTDELPIFRIPWGHNAVLLEKLKKLDQRLWYAQKTIEHGWSRTMLEMWIESDLYRREGKAVTNFKKTLPIPQSDLAQQSLKDPYLFDFLTLHSEHLEKEIEQGLIDHIQRFLLELGQGFAFVARQHHLEVGGKDYYIDLLFYHLKLRCYVVIELKATEFDPRDAGQINFYLSAVDDLVRMSGDGPTIGLLLCKSKNNITVEYALRDLNKPIGVAGYETKLVESLPKNLKGSLPTVQEIEAELEKQDVLTSRSGEKKR